MSDQQIEGGEAFDVEQAYADCITFTEIEEAAKKADGLFSKYLQEVKTEAILAMQQISVVDPRDYSRVSDLQNTIQRHVLICDWVQQKLSVGAEAAAMLSDWQPEPDLTPDFADQDQPEEADHGSEDD